MRNRFEVLFTGVAGVFSFSAGVSGMLHLSMIHVFAMTIGAFLMGYAFIKF